MTLFRADVSHVMELFGKMDANGNGLIELDEFGAMWEQLAPAEVTLPPAKDEVEAKRQRTFRRFDRSGTGALDREDVRALL